MNSAEYKIWISENKANLRLTEETIKNGKLYKQGATFNSIANKLGYTCAMWNFSWFVKEKKVKEKDANPTKGRENLYFHFDKVGIKIGDELEFVKAINGKTLVVKVATNNFVNYNGFEYSLSALVNELYKEYFTEMCDAHSGPKMFTFKGEKLSEIAKKMGYSIKNKD